MSAHWFYHPTIYSLGVLVLGGYLLVRKMDVRLVLAMCVFVLFAIAHRIPLFFETFAQKMVDGRFVVPICTAWGFAHVLRLTGCDAHLVRLLLKPVQRARWAIIPGGVVVAFLVNTAI